MKEINKAIICRKCGKPHGLQIDDAGSDREIDRTCEKCFKSMKEITTNGIAILIVEVPEDAREFQIRTSRIGDLFYKTNQNDIGYGKDTLPIGQYQILGKSTELSEEQMKGICWQVSFGNYTGYKNYNQAKCSDFRDIVESSFSTVQESYLSLLEANGIVDRNPYGDNCPPDVEPENDDDLGVVSSIRYQKIGQWRVAQSKVKHYLVLKRI